MKHGASFSLAEREAKKQLRRLRAIEETEGGHFDVSLLDLASHLSRTFGVSAGTAREAAQSAYADVVLGGDPR